MHRTRTKEPLFYKIRHYRRRGYISGQHFGASRLAYVVGHALTFDGGMTVS